MFENLSERLERSFKLLKGQGKITEINVAETLKDVRRALLDADVNYSVAKQFTDTVKAKALGQNVITAVKPSELMVKIVHDELALLMGGVAADVNLSGNPTVILMSGLQGSGKTTFSGKLAKKFKSEKGKHPLLVACDVYRPAAIEQLKVLGEQIDVPVYTEPESKNPVEIARNAIKHAKAHNYDMVIVDTAGRLAVDEQMMDAHFDCISDVLYVALGQRWQFYACSRDVHALPRPEFSVVHCRAEQLFAVDAVDAEVELAIVDKQVHSDLYVFGNVRI